MAHIITTIEIGDRTFPVMVNADGRFYAEGDGETISAPTLLALKQKMRLTFAAIRRVEIPAVLIESNDTLTEISLLGCHAGNGNVLYKAKGKKGAQQLYSHSDRVLRPLTTDERAEHKELRRAERAATTAVNKWISARRMNAIDAVNKVLAQRAKTT